MSADNGTTPLTSCKADEFANLHRVGAYLFFAVCAFSNGVLAGVLLSRTWINEDMQSLARSLVTLATFLALRDMTKRHPPTPALNSSGAMV